MDIGTWTLVTGGVIGLALALFGARVLATGRAPASTTRAFRSTRDAGLYHLLFGAGLMLLVAGTALPGDSTGVVTAVLAVTLAAVAVVRHRPQPERAAAGKDAEAEQSERAAARKNAKTEQPERTEMERQ
jgi:hypothetical protein